MGLFFGRSNPTPKPSLLERLDQKLFSLSGLQPRPTAQLPVPAKRQLPARPIRLQVTRRCYPQQQEVPSKSYEEQ